MTSLLALAMVLGNAIVANAQTDAIVGGYFPAEYRTLDNIAATDWANLSMAFYAFINTDANGNITGEKVDYFNRMVDSCDKHGVQLYASFGGAYGSSVIYSMANNATARENFVQKMKTLCDKYGLEGVDIDWEGLTTSGERTAHEALMKRLNEVLTPAGYKIILTIGWGNFNAQWFSTAAVGYADYLQIMAYDNRATWPQSPAGNHSSYSDAVAAVDYWKTTRGISASKLILGLPNYGYQQSNTGGSGTAKTYGQIRSTYPTLTDADDEVAVDANTTIWYNGPLTIKKKGRMAMVDKGIAGLFYWEMTQDTDDAKALHDALIDTLSELDYTVAKLPLRDAVVASTFTSTDGHQSIVSGTLNGVWIWNEHQGARVEVLDLTGRIIAAQEALPVNGAAPSTIPADVSGLHLVRIYRNDQVEGHLVFIE